MTLGPHPEEPCSLQDLKNEDWVAAKVLDQMPSIPLRILNQLGASKPGVMGCFCVPPWRPVSAQRPEGSYVTYRPGRQLGNTNMTLGTVWALPFTSTGTDSTCATWGHALPGQPCLSSPTPRS